MFKIPPLLFSFSYIFAYIFNTYCTCQTNCLFRNRGIFSWLYGSDECSVFSFVNLSIQTFMCFCFAIFYSIKTLNLWFPTTEIRIPVGSSERFCNVLSCRNLCYSFVDFAKDNPFFFLSLAITVKYMHSAGFRLSLIHI